MAAVGCWLYEKRPLKRPRLGPPDVYPQDPKQKEDELTAVNVKQGFLSNPLIQDEYGSARNSNITAAKFGAFFSAILTKKQELNTFQDSGRRRQQINPKDNFWPVTPRSKNALEAWFKDLAGSKPLSSLGKKVPIFNKKEEIFMMLYEYSVPMLRATWFIKMSSAYTVAISEAKIKKRQLSDPCQEWSQALCKFLRDQIQKLADYYHNNATVTPSTGSAPPAVTTGSTTVSTASPTTGAGITAEVSYKQWQYCIQLARHLYEETLLDRQEFLTWVLELIEKTKSVDDPIMKVVLALAVQYVGEFVRSELLCRRLASHCAKKLGQLIGDHGTGSPRSQSPMMNNSTSTTVTATSPVPPQQLVNPLTASFCEFLNCSHHRSIVLQLSAILQVITLECPSALVWNNIGEGKSSSILNGSPLDLLPCAPSSLPMPPRPTNAQVRAQLRQAENLIKERGRAAEVWWSCEKWQQAATGATIQRVLNALDALDRHAFDRVDSTYSIDSLYSKIFPAPANKETPTMTAAESLAFEEPIIQLLCEWSVTTRRCGEHRALVVAKLLEKRQNDLVAEKYSEADIADEKDSQDSSTMVSIGLPIYQNLLVNFLDTQAPYLEDKPSAENKKSFANLVLLFTELTRLDVFSHDAYMCTLISRGLLANPIASHPPPPPTPSVQKLVPTPEPSLTGFIIPDPTRGLSPGLGGPASLGALSLGMVGPPLPMFEPVDNRSCSVKAEVPWDMQMDMDDARLDADLDKLLQHIKEGQQNMSDQPDILLPESVGSDRGDATPLSSTTPLSHPPLLHGSAPVEVPVLPTPVVVPPPPPAAPTSTQRHLMYTTHFPLPQDETAFHDCNQRHILLYGVGKARDEARHTVKKVTKEITKLFSKKTCMDIADGGKVKKHAREGFNFESVVARFQGLSYFDQHVVTLSCASSVVEMLNAFATGNSNYLPLVEFISFLFDLMELALNVHGIIEFSIQLLKELAEVEIQLTQKGSVLSGNYATSVGLHIVGVLFHYHCSLLVSQQQTLAVFEGLCKITKHLPAPTECSSAERCILCYLYDLSSACTPLKSKHSELFMYSKVKQTLYASQSPSAVNLLWNTTYMIDYINTPKMKIDPQQVMQLNDSAASRYSFVCNAVHSISIARDTDRLNEISTLCAELTACCSCLSAEWLGVLKALCCSSNHGCGFIDVLTQVDVGDLSIHDNLAVFTAILVARRCFSLQDFVVHVALPSLLSACPAGGSDQDAEGGARLTCHLLLCMFKTAETVPTSMGLASHSSSPAAIVSGPANHRPVYLIKSPCDRHLLAAARNSIRVEAVLAVLKAILVLGDSADGASISKVDQLQSKGEISIKDILGSLDDPDFDVAPPPALTKPTPTAASGSGMESAGLSEFAKHALKQICSQDWVHERCLRDPEMLCSQDLLLDPMLSHKQAQNLLHMICHPEDTSQPYDENSDQKQTIIKILQNLDQWTLRVSWLELQLIYKQCAPQPADVSTWLENIARATIDVFQMTSEEPLPVIKSSNCYCSGDICVVSKSALGIGGLRDEDRPGHVWLIAPLISKLPATVQGKILRVAGQVLESGNWATPAPSVSSMAKNKEKEKSVPKSCSLLSHQPFLSLVLMCLKGQDDQREGLLNSLSSQLSQCLHMVKDEKLSPDDIRSQPCIQEALQLRLSLVGGMFDMIQKNNTLTLDWAILLVQLIAYSIVEPETNYELFTTVLDMLAVLTHSTQVSDTSSGERSEEMRKQYLNLVKKLKKEIADKDNEALKTVWQLLPLPKQHCDVITCEPMGSLIDTKGNKIAGFDSIDKKQGLQVSEKQNVSPWDLIEGHKNPAPLSWAWFGAVRMERKVPRQEELHRLLLWHTHSLVKPTSHFLDPLPLPPEDLEPPQEKPQQIPPPMIYIEEMKRGRETPLDHSPRTAAKKPKQPRRRRQPKMTAGQQPAPMRPGMGYPEQQPMYNQAPPPQGWYAGQGPPTMQQNQYYSQQQPLPPGGARISQSKAALTTMLRARHPTNYPQQAANAGPAANMQSSMPPQGGPVQGHPGHPGGPSPYQNMEMMQKQRQQMMMRQQMRPQGMPGGPGGMYPNGTGQTAPLHHLPPQNPGMNQGYGNYNNPQQMQPNVGYNQTYMPPQAGPAMMNPGPMRTQQGQYGMPAQPAGRGQYQISQPGMQAPNVTVSQMGSNMGPGNGSHMPVSGGGNPNSMGPGGMQNVPQQAAPMNHMQPLRHPTAALVAHLHRQLSNSGQQPQQHHQYHQGGPY